MKSFLLLILLLPIVTKAQDKFSFRIRSDNHTSRIDAVMITADGKYTLSCSYDKTIKVWDTETGDFLWEYSAFYGNGRDGGIVSFDLDPLTSNVLAAGGTFNDGDLNDSLSGRILLFDFKTRKITRELYGHNWPVVSMRFLNDGIHLVSADQTGHVILWNLKTGHKKWFRTNDGAEPYITRSDKGFIITSSTSRFVYHFTPENFPLEPIHTFKIKMDENTRVASTTFLPSRHLFLIGTFNNKILVYDRNFHLSQVMDNFTIPSGFAFNNTESIVAAGRSMGQENINFYSFKNDTLEIMQRLGGFYDLIKGMAFTQNDQLMVGDNETGGLTKITKENMAYKIDLKILKSGLPSYSVGVPRGTEQGKIYFSVSQAYNSKGFSPFTHVFDLVNRKISPLKVNSFYATKPITEIGELSLESGESGSDRFSNVLRLVKYGEEKPILEIKSLNVFRCYTYTRDTSMIIAGGRDGVLEAFDNKGKKICNLQGHTGDLFCINESPDQKFLISSAREGLIHFWDKKSILTNYSIYPSISIYFQSAEDWVIWTSEGYFTSTRSGARMLGFQQNFGRNQASRFIPIEVFDMTYNRPDIVFEKLGVKNPELIQLYQKAAEKRLKKSGLKVFPVFDAFHLPEIKYETQNATTSNEWVSVVFSAKDPNNLMKKIFVLNQGVPVTEIELKKNEKKSYSGQINLPLSDGKNTIEIFATTDLGLRSIGEKLIIQKSGKRKKKLYMVAVSVSDYQDTSMSLKYAVKDGRDIRNAMAKTALTSFDEIITDTLFNTDATKPNIQKLRQTLSTLSSNDAVVLYFSGHGFLDKEGDFFYGTFNVNADKPGINGMAFKEIESLFDSCKALKRLILLDACHSGEVDKEEIETLQTSNDLTTAQPNLSTYAPKGTKLLNQNTGTASLSSFDVLQEMFASVSTSNGIEIIAASAGNNYAFESDLWQNGVFTYCILKALTDSTADKNNDHHISISEIKKYVAENVLILTNGRQKPAMRQEINAQEWFLR